VALRRTPRDLGGRVVVVTGASSGIGRATAVALAGRRARVVLAARDAAGLEEVAQECHALGGEALAVPTDVTDAEAVDALARRAVERFGTVDAWVNAAAVMSYGTFEETPDEVVRRVIETNLFGVVNCSRTALRCFRERDEGVLVNIASLYAKMTSPLVSAYVTSKYGVLGFSEVLRQELIGSPIRVSTVLPGSIDTPIFRQAANYTGKRTRPIPPVLDSSRVVRTILRCLDHPRDEVSVGFVARFLALGHTMFPRLYDRLAGPAMYFAALAPDDAPPSSGNVFGPNPDGNEVEGDWRRTDVRWGALVAGTAAGAVTLLRARRRNE
jgi:short-subunit dehydrogenase